MFSILGLSATLYPIITKLEEYKILEKQLVGPGLEKLNFLDLIELIDVRVYKVRGTDPKADIAGFTHKISKEDYSTSNIEEWLLWYNERWMNAGEFRNNLYGPIYKRSRAVLAHAFLDFSENINKTELSIEELKNFVKEKAFSIEHILSQKPKFALKTHGFRNNEEYLEYEHTLGNLTLLEKPLNSSVNNKNVFEKVDYYDRSIFKMTKKLASDIMHQQQFKKEDIINRTKVIADYLEQKWWCKHSEWQMEES